MPLSDFLSDFLGNGPTETPGQQLTIAQQGKQAWDNRSYVFPPNYAAKIRALDAGVRSALVIPRRPFTFIADFIYGDHANKDMLSANARQVTANIKSVEKPGFQFDVETLYAYNTPRLITKRVQAKDITVTFYDDATSFITGMLRAYRAHYAYSGLVTDAGEVLSQPAPSTGSHWQNSLPKTSTTDIIGTVRTSVGGGPLNLLGAPGGDGETEAAAQDTDERGIGLPSYGLRPLQVPFFEAIKIYDLGSEPSSVNVYTLINPVIKDINMPTLDYSDGAGQQEITVVFASVGVVTEVCVPIDSEDLNGVDLFKTHFDSESENIANSSGRGAVFEGSGFSGIEGVMERIQDPRQRTLFGNLLRAVQSSVQGGEINWQDLQRNVFETAVAGTPIQNIRQSVTNIRQIEQAVRQGRILDAASLLSNLDVLREGIPGLNSNSSVGNVITRIGDETRNIISGTEDAFLGAVSDASSWLSRHTNPLPSRTRGSSLPSKELIDGGG